MNRIYTTLLQSSVLVAVGLGLPQSAQAQALPDINLPHPFTAPQLVQVDIVLGPLEKNRIRSVSGSYAAGFNVPCTVNCAHLELGDPQLGKHWMSGKYHQVASSGFGELALLCGAREPTGRHPFGSNFKVVIWEVNEASATAEVTAFLRACAPGLGCSGYCFGPIPWFVTQEKGLIPF